MKAVQLLINSFLPEDLRNYDQTFDAKSINKILYAVARKHPDRFADIAKKISDVGRKASYYQGETIRLEDLAPAIDKASIFARMEDEIKSLPRNKEFKKNRRTIWQKYNDLVEKETAANALKQGNNIAISVLSGARGKVPQLKALNATPGLYSDYKGRPVDVFIKESFGDGVRPAAFLAGAFGTRSSTVSTKVNTARGGDLAKQMGSIAANMVVREKNCGTANGVLMELDRDRLNGRMLARDAAGHKAGEFIDRRVMEDMRKAGIKKVEVRSPLTCRERNGLCAYCVGKFYNGGKLPRIGEAVGLTASTTGFEPIAQSALSAKHTSGMTQGKREYSGLEVIEQFVQSPESFRDKAPVAEHDGAVESIEEAPQGGSYVTVDGQRHYVPLGHSPIVKVGERVEAGDQLAEGLVDPEDVVRLKGIGAGRKYYTDRLNRILADSGAGTDSLNTEILARAAINHVRIDSPDGLDGHLPDDIVLYDGLQSSYKVPETATEMEVRQAAGRYLQAPELHYTIGTRITPKIASELEQAGRKTVLADENPPAFVPEMVRLRAASHANPDWLASMGTSYLSKQLEESAIRGDDTNIASNEDYRPRLAVGIGFGENVEQTGRF